MKRRIRASSCFDPSSYSNMLMSEMAIFFSNSAMRHIPEVEVELNSFNISDDTLTWYGDMIYQRDNQPLEISIKGRITEDMSFDDFGKAYFSDMISEYIRQLNLIYGI